MDCSQYEVNAQRCWDERPASAANFLCKLYFMSYHIEDDESRCFHPRNCLQNAKVLLFSLKLKQLSCFIFYIMAIPALTAALFGREANLCFWSCGSLQAETLDGLTQRLEVFKLKSKKKKHCQFNNISCSIHSILFLFSFTSHCAYFVFHWSYNYMRFISIAIMGI